MLIELVAFFICQIKKKLQEIWNEVRKDWGKSTPSCAVKSQCFYLACLMPLMGCCKRTGNPLATTAFQMLSICGNTLWKLYGSRLLIFNERQFHSSGPMGEAEMCSWCKACSQAQTWEINSGGGMTKVSSWIVTGKRQSQQTLKAQRWHVHYPLKATWPTAFFTNTRFQEIPALTAISVRPQQCRWLCVKLASCF